MLDIFDAVCVVNGTGDDDPWYSTVRHLYEVGHPLKHPIYRVVGEKINGDYTTRQIAAADTHLACIELAKQKGMASILIVEDDVLFEHIEYIPAVERDLKKRWADWDLFFYGANVVGPMSKVSNYLMRLSRSLALHAYAVPARMYDTLLDLRPRYHAAESEYDVLICDHIIPTHTCLIAHPMVAIQKPGWSNLRQEMVDYRWLYWQYIGHLK